MYSRMCFFVQLEHSISGALMKEVVLRAVNNM